MPKAPKTRQSGAPPKKQSYADKAADDKDAQNFLHFTFYDADDKREKKMTFHGRLSKMTLKKTAEKAIIEMRCKGWKSDGDTKFRRFYPNRDGMTKKQDDGRPKVEHRYDLERKTFNRFKLDANVQGDPKRPPLTRCSFQAQLKKRPLDFEFNSVLTQVHIERKKSDDKGGYPKITVEMDATFWQDNLKGTENSIDKLAQAYNQAQNTNNAADPAKANDTPRGAHTVDNLGHQHCAPGAGAPALNAANLAMLPFGKAPGNIKDELDDEVIGNSRASTNSNMSAGLQSDAGAPGGADYMDENEQFVDLSEVTEQDHAAKQKMAAAAALQNAGGDDDE